MDRQYRILSALSVLSGAGMSDSEIAEALGVCSASRVSEYRNGVHTPAEGTVRHAESLASVIVRPRRSRCLIARWWPVHSRDLIRLPNRYDDERKWRRKHGIAEIG